MVVAEEELVLGVLLEVGSMVEELDFESALMVVSLVALGVVL